MVQDQLYRTISEYPLDFVGQRLIKKGGFDEATAKTAVEELKKFLYICAIEDGKPIAMISPTVDEAWHTFILFAKEYENFCRNIAARFLHHRPITDSTPAEKSRDGVRYFVESYWRYFGELPQIWLDRGVESMCERDPENCYQDPRDCEHPGD